jgi:tape measure domain-containing protein
VKEGGIEMASVQSSLTLFDAFTRPLQNITQALNLTLSAMKQLQSSTDKNANIAKTFDAAKQKIAAAEAEISTAINQATQAQNKFNQSAKKGGPAVKSIVDELHKGGQAIVALNQGLELIQKVGGGIQKGMSLADEMTSTNTRLALVNDGLRTQEQFQSQVLDVANRTRASYNATADLITKVGAGTQGIFKTDDSLLSFAERFNKSLAISGATATESETAIMQMSQALGSGVLQGDELRSISESAPVLMRILADGLGVARGQLKQMGADGELTADKVVRAFENQGQQIDSMFEKMPVTFGGAMTILQNTFNTWFGTLNQANGPLQNITAQVQRLSAFLQSAQGQQFFAGLADNIATAVDWLIRFIEIGAQVYTFISSNWTIFEPIIIGIIAAVAAWTVAQWALNIALTANPIGAIIMAVAALIGIYVAIIVYIVKLWKTNDDFAAGLIRAWNGILNFFDKVPIFFQIMGNGIVNAFQWAKVKSLELIESLANSTIDRINGLIGKLNKIPGVSLKTISHVEFNSNAAAEAEAIRQAGENKVAQMQESAADKAAEREQKVLDMLNNRAAERAAEQAEKDAKKAAAPTIPSLFSPDINRVNEVGKIKDKVDISSEDLKIMRELAEMKTIQNFVTLTPTVQVGDINQYQPTDVDEMIQKIKDSMTQEITTSAKGVYDLGG